MIPLVFIAFFVFFLQIHLQFMKIGQIPKDLVLKRTWSFIIWYLEQGCHEFGAPPPTFLANFCFVLPNFENPYQK